MNHQAALSLWGAQFPIGVVASLVLVLALLAGLRLVFDTRLLPGLAAVGLLASVGLLSLMSAGGSVLVPGNPVGWSWTFGAPIIALMVLGWPRSATDGGHPTVVWGMQQHPKGISTVTYVIALPCVDVKDRACVDECPVDCIYEGDRMLYIHPDECVDCGACEPVCPVEAIYYEDDLPSQWADYYKANVEFFDDLGSPGGASKLGIIHKDHPIVAALPPQTAGV